MSDATDPLSPASGPKRGKADVRVGEEAQIPRLYIATPLTSLDARAQRSFSYRIKAVQAAIDDATIHERAEYDQWPVALHIPFQVSPPWVADGLSGRAIYERNLDEMLDCDGLIVLTDNTGSAGIGQEIEWAARSGIPVLYLSDSLASRQIRGIPHAIAAAPCEDSTAMAFHVRNWLRNNRAALQHGPTRRADRFLAYLKITAQIEVAWKAPTTNQTAVASQLGLHPDAIYTMIGSPMRVALTPWWTVCELAAALGVSLDARRSLSFAESRAWTSAAAQGAWEPLVAERVRAHALNAQLPDLELSASWLEAHRQMYDVPGTPPAATA